MLPEDYVKLQEKKQIARDRLNVSLIRNQRSMNWRYAPQRQPVLAQQAAREFGKGLAPLVHQYRKGDIYLSELVDYLNDNVPAFMKHKARNIANALDIGGEVWTCHDCGALIVCDDDSGYTDENEARVCELCVNNGDYQWSECMGCYLSPNTEPCPVFNSVCAAGRDDADDYCTRRYGEYNLYPFDHDTHSYAFFRDSSDYEDWCTQNDEDSDNFLPDYHGSLRRGNGYFDEVNAEGTRPALGVEVEVYTGSDRDASLEYLRAHGHTWINGLVLERDGSLHEDESFEAVTRPLGWSEWKTYGPTLCRALNDAGCVGFNTPGSTRYGIHVNVHRRWLSPLAEARMMLFLCSRQNRAFVQAVAQRATIYHPDIDIGQFTPDCQNVYSLGGLGRVYQEVGAPIRKIQGRGKYTPLAFKDDIAEFRMFQSTLNVKSFMKNLEFVWALYAWTKPEAATGRTWDHVEFCTWLNQPAQRKEYPQLVEFLSKNTFTLKGGAKITSTWSHLMHKPSQEDFCEIRAA